MGSWAETKATYRFWASDDIEAEEIRKAHALRTAERMKEAGTVVVLQDTTELDFTSHSATQGLGVLSYNRRRSLPTEQEQSHKWIKTEAAVQERLGGEGQVVVVMVADRKGHL